MRKTNKHIWVVLAYLVIVGLVFAPSLFPQSGFMLYGDDIHRQYYFYREFFNHWLSRGVFPWWNPYLFGGEPFIANPVVNIWYPPTWLFSLLPLTTAYSWHLYFHIVWASVGMYTLSQFVSVRAGRPKEWLSSWISGVVFGLSGFFMARTFAGHVDVIAAASWMPWVVFGFWKLVSLHGGVKSSNRIAYVVGSNPSLFIFASVFFAMQLFAGYQTMAFFTVIIVGIFTLIEAGIQRSVRPVVCAVAAGAMGIGLAALQIVPEQEFFRQSIRTYALPYSWISYGAITWKSLLQLVNPFLFGNQFTYMGPPPNFIEHSMYVGKIGITLALGAICYFVWAVVKGKKITSSHLATGAFMSVLVIGVWMALGPNAWIDLQKIAWQLVPMYHYLRIPSRHLVIVVFGLSGLAGIGIAGIKSQGVRMALSALVVVELVMFGKGFIEIKPIPESRHDMKLIKLLTSDDQPTRILQNFGVWLAPRDALDFDSVMSYGIYSATGYDPSIYKPYYEFVANAAGKKGEEAVLEQDVQVPYLSLQSEKAIDSLNIKYIMTPKQYDPFGQDVRYKPVYADDSKSYIVYENAKALPRFYFARTDCGTAHIDVYTPNRIRISVDAKCDDTLLSSEVWYPGWVAYVDGKKTDISKTNDAFRSLFVSRGKHTIVYEYHPTIFLIGAAISMLSIAVLFWITKKS